MREIGVHLNHQIRVQRQRPRETLNIRRSQSLLAGAMQHIDTTGAVRPRQLIRGHARAIRRIVVHHQHMQIRDRERQKRRHDPPDILPLVIGGKDDYDLGIHR